MKVSWVLLGILGLTSECWGFSLDRSVPVGWDSPPVLESEQARTLKRIFNEKIQVTGIDKVLQPSEEKKLIKFGDEKKVQQLREKRAELVTTLVTGSQKPITLREINDDIVLPVEENSSFFPRNEENDIPRNVVLLFIDESGQDRETLWKSLKTSNNFSVQGTLQSCGNDRNLVRFPLDEVLVSGPTSECECENILRSNVDSLLSWAHRTKEMTTGTISATNFSRLSTFGNESPFSIRQNFEELDGNNNMKIFKPQLHNVWHLIDLDKEPISSTTPSFAFTTAKREGDGMWDIFDTFSKIRIAFFRNWLESLNNNAVNKENEFSPRRPIPLHVNLLELMGDTVEKLKSISGDKGFIMVAFAPGNELSSAIDLLQKEISAKDTLLVVAGICSQDKKEVPFFAHGPGTKYFSEANSIWDLPILVKKAVSGCQGLWCKIESLNPIWEPNQNFHKRFARDKIHETVDENLTIVSNGIVSNTTYDNTTISNTTDNNTRDNNTTVSNTTVSNTTVSNTTVSNTTDNNTKDNNITVSNTTISNIPVNNTTVNNATDSNAIVSNRRGLHLIVSNMNISSTTVNNTRDLHLIVSNMNISSSTDINTTEGSEVFKEMKASTETTVENKDRINRIYHIEHQNHAEDPMKNHSSHKTKESTSENRPHFDEALETRKQSTLKTPLDYEANEKNMFKSEASRFAREATVAIIGAATSFVATLLLNF